MITMITMIIKVTTTRNILPRSHRQQKERMKQREKR